MDVNQIRRERRIRWGFGSILAPTAIYFMWLIATRSAEPRAYFQHRRGLVGHWSYPTSSVAISCGLVAAEALVLTRSKTILVWARGLVGVALAAPVAIVGTLTSMHSPPYCVFHVLWLIYVTMLMVAIVLVFAAAHIAGRIAASRRPPLSAP
jgi:hypothetical protein